MPIEAEALLAAKLHDAVKLSEKRPMFLGFLNEEEAAFCLDILERERIDNFTFWGGYDGAERTFLGVFPEYMEADNSAFPITPLTFSYRNEFTLSHRDFLGSFMALGIERSVVGDIVINKESGSCTAFIKQEMEDHFLQNISKIGRVGVRISKGVSDDFKTEREYSDISGVIASPRLDCIVALLCRTGRGKAADTIKLGLVTVNHKEALSASQRVDEGDIITVRKYGKFIIDRLGPLTSKGRLAVMCRKYK